MADDEVGEVRVEPARRRKRGRRLTVMGMLVLVALAAVAMGLYRGRVSKGAERLSIRATFQATSPVADGVIGAKEYGPPVTITWTEDNSLAAFQPYLLDPTKSPVPGDLATAPVRVDPTKSKTPADLSVLAYAAYTDTSLFLAFRVRDQFVDAEEEDRLRPEYNDGVEVFIDGDHEPGDFTDSEAIAGVAVTGDKEGFQLLANAAGHKLGATRDFTIDDWKAAAGRVPDGYVVEMEIPLALIDTADGPPFAPAGSGSLLHLGFAVTDNDAEVSRQMSYAYLRTPTQTTSPFLGREREWNFGIKLVPRWSFSPW